MTVEEALELLRRYLRRVHAPEPVVAAVTVLEDQIESLESSVYMYQETQ